MIEEETINRKYRVPNFLILSNGRSIKTGIILLKVKKITNRRKISNLKS